MPKHYKKPKGVDAHQHVAGEDWTKAEPWVADMINLGRLVVEGPDAVAVAFPGLPLSPVASTDWIVLDESGALSTMTDAVFLATYEKDTRAEVGGA